MRTVLRTLWVALNLIVATLLIGAIAIVIGLTRHEGPIYWTLSRQWCRWLLWASGTPVLIEGLEHLEVDRPQILVSNHASWYDVLVIGAAVPKHFRFVAKKELGRIPVFGLAWRLAGHISIDRSDRLSAIQTLARAGEVLRSDNSIVVIFPEGTRSPTGDLLPFKKGAFMLALGTGVEVVPAAVIGSRRVLAKGDWLVHAAPIILRIGSPIASGGYDETTREELVEAVRERVLELRDGVPTAAPAVTS